MFSCCYELVSVVWPRDLLEIGNSAFLDCWKLAKADFPATVQVLGDSAFRNCSAMEKGKNYTLPGSVRKIGRLAFYQTGCYGITLPASVERVYFDAFITLNGSVSFMNKTTAFLDNPETFQQLYDSFKSGRLPTVSCLIGSTASEFASDPAHPFQLVYMISPSRDLFNAPQEVKTTLRTVTFTDLKPDTLYNFYDRLGDELTGETLLYLAQETSDADGRLTVNYRTVSDDTAAEKYVRCRETEEAEEILFGDADCSGDISIADAILLARFLAEDTGAYMTAEGKICSDCNHDGLLTSDDVIVLLRYLAGINNEI